MKRRWTALLYLILVFLSGVLVGSVGYGLYNARSAQANQGGPSRDERIRRYKAELRNRLNLGPEQAQQLDSIFANTDQRFREVREKWRPEVKAIQDEQHHRIRAMLDDNQKAEYDRMREERERQHPQARH